MSRVDEIVNESRELLDTAKFGLEQVKLGPEKRKSGIRNVAVFGRMVTFAINNLRGKVEGFEEWDACAKKEFFDNQHCRQMVEFRNIVEKQAKVPLSSSGHIKSFDRSVLERLSPPPNAKGFFAGDRFGGSGWVVSGADGKKTNFYVDLPGDLGVFRSNLETERHGSSDMVETAEAYIDSLERYLEAVSHFVSEKNK